jgi:hypothetical protein
MRKQREINEDTSLSARKIYNNNNNNNNPFHLTNLTCAHADRFIIT